MIDVTSLAKSYGDLRAVDDVSFCVNRGEAFGLLGPNGAGKSTTIHLLAGVIAPDRGKVRLDGADPQEAIVRTRLGVSPQELAIYEELTGEENLRIFAALYGLRGDALVERVHWALDFAGLTDRRKDRAAKYSGGMKRRLNLACAVVHDPELLICDEPTVGVDPQSRNHIFESIEALRASGTTLIYTTHYMSEAQRLCDRVAIMDHGKLLAADTVDALIEAHGGSSLVLAEFDEPPPADAQLPGTLDGTQLRVDSDKPFELAAELGRGPHRVRSLRVERPDLEKVFLQLTGRSLRDS
ncbi:MAG: antibiotic ABC transporter ATP-binding protein [Planctomycetota bacterium]|nr:MAG: antibiotic ABC transporter ATP-binding protein [Planctomycetota bacterium]